MLSFLFLLAAFSHFVSAGIFVTYPVAATSIAGGTTFNITWQADVIQTLPLASSFGTSMVGLYTGGSQVQFSVVAFNQVQDPVKTNMIQVTIPSTAGPNSGSYFIRFESLNSTLAAPIEAFSARFTLTNMTGTFTAAEIAENASNSTLTPITSSAAPTSTSATSTMITSTTSTTANITSSSTASASATPKSSAQMSRVNVVGSCLVGVLSVVALVL